MSKTYDYDAYGNEIAPVAGDGNPFRYCGEFWDNDAGTYYLRARNYDPTIGRFLSEDTHWNVGNMIYGDREYGEGEKKVADILAINQSNNLYAYCVSNPVKFMDQSGDFVVSALVIGILVGALVAGGINLVNQQIRKGHIDWGEFAISLIAGGISGALAGFGIGWVGQIVGNAAISAVNSVAVNIYYEGWDLTAVDYEAILVDAFLGAAAGAFGGSGAATKHMKSMELNLFKKLGKLLSFKNFSKDGLKRVSRSVYQAFAYYASQTSKQHAQLVAGIIRATLPWLADCGYDVWKLVS